MDKVDGKTFLGIMAFFITIIWLLIVLSQPKELLPRLIAVNLPK